MKATQLHINAFLSAAILIFALNASSKTIYTWIDRNGAVHITEAPPPDHGRLQSAIEYSPQSQDQPQSLPSQLSGQNKIREIDAAVKNAETLRQRAESAKQRAAAAQAESTAADRRLAEVKTQIARNRQLLTRNRALVERLEAEALDAKRRAIAAAQQAELTEKTALEAEKNALEMLSQKDQPQPTAIAPHTE